MSPSTLITVGRFLTGAVQKTAAKATQSLLQTEPQQNHSNKKQEKAEAKIPAWTCQIGNHWMRVQQTSLAGSNLPWQQNNGEPGFLLTFKIKDQQQQEIIIPESVMTQFISELADAQNALLNQV